MNAYGGVIVIISPKHVWLFICCKTKLKKNNFFLKKYLCFLQNIHYLQKKITLHGKKNYIDIFFTEKGFFTENEKKKYLI